MKVRPSVFVFHSLNKKQKKIFSLLYLNEPVECPVCYNVITHYNKSITSCDHTFCTDCSNKLFNSPHHSGGFTPCPCCRTPVEHYTYSGGPLIIYVRTIMSFHMFYERQSMNYFNKYPIYKTKKHKNYLCGLR